MSPTPRYVDCRCGRPHSEHFGHDLAPQCIHPGSTCLRYVPNTAPDRPVGRVTSPSAAPPPAVGSSGAAEAQRQCNGCLEWKPVSEFYVKGDGQVQPKCKDCDNTRPRKATLTRIVRVRARHRAVAALIKAHGDEFRNLLNYFTDVVLEESAELAAAAAAAAAEAEREHAHEVDEPELPRLRPGPRRPGQVVKDRIDVGRCPECVGYHDRGHRCAACGAEPAAAKAG